MVTFLIITEIILSLIIVGVVLLQKSSSLGLGAYSGSNESLFGAKGPASFLSKITMFLGALFLVNTIYLGYVLNTSGQKSVLDNETKLESNPLSTPLNETLNPLNAPLESSITESKDQ